MNQCGLGNCGNKEFGKTGLCQTHYRARSGKLCTFPDCDRGHRANGFCSGHLAQLSDGRELAPLGPRGGKRKVLTGQGLCSFDGCGRKVYARGLCGTHDKQRRRGQELYPIGQPSQPTRTGICELCEEHRGLVWDHDNDTGTFRGWICTPCNTALGRLGDNSEGLARALEYVSRVR